MKTGVFVFKHVDADAAEGSAAGYSPEEGCTDCSGLFGILAPIRPLFSLSRKKVCEVVRSRIPFKSTRAVQPGIHGDYSLSHQVSLAPDGITSQGRFTKRRLAS